MKQKGEPQLPSGRVSRTIRNEDSKDRSTVSAELPISKALVPKWKLGLRGFLKAFFSSSLKHATTEAAYATRCLEEPMSIGTRSSQAPYSVWSRIVRDLRVFP